MIDLRYPAPALWPNKRLHWTAKWKASQQEKLDAYMLMNCYVREHGYPKSVSRLQITLYPKQRGPVPDRDNIVAACKAVQDGVCGALKIDDKTLDVPKIVIGERRKDGGLSVSVIE